MIVYSKKPMTLRYIRKSVPSFLKCDAIVQNQIYYSYQLLRKEYSYTSDILRELFENAAICGTVNEVHDLCDLFLEYDLNKVLAYKVGFKPTYLSEKKLRHLIEEELANC